MSPGSWGATLTAAGVLVALVRAVQEAVAALGEHDAGLAVLAPELLARAGQGAARGCNTRGATVTKGFSCSGKGNSSASASKDPRDGGGGDPTLAC